MAVGACLATQAPAAGSFSTVASLPLLALLPLRRPPRQGASRPLHHCRHTITVTTVTSVTTVTTPYHRTDIGTPVTSVTPVTAVTAVTTVHTVVSLLLSLPLLPLLSGHHYRPAASGSSLDITSVTCVTSVTQDPAASDSSLDGDALCVLAAVFYATYDLRLFYWGKRVVPVAGSEPLITTVTSLPP